MAGQFPGAGAGPVQASTNDDGITALKAIAQNLGQLSGAFTNLNNSLIISENARLAITQQAVTTASASLNIDMSLGWHVSLTLSHTITALTVSNVPVSGQLGKITFDITSTGAFNISDWPGTTIWASGAAPVITSGSGAKDTIVLTTTDGGLNWRGYTVAQAMS